MASGDTLIFLDPLGAVSPPTAFATRDILATTTDVPLISIPVLDFAGSTANESMDWHITVPSNYSGTTGFTFSVQYASDGTVAGTVEWEIRAVTFVDGNDLSADLNIDGATAATVTDTLPGDPETDKFNQVATVALAKASMGTPSAGDRMVIRVTRDQATDTSTDDAQLIGIEVRDT